MLKNILVGLSLTALVYVLFQCDSPSGKANYTCQGKTTCSQMTSCDEATFYLRNCPNTQMDGDSDGVPCEQQWCK